MSDDLENTRENMVLGMMGQRVRAGHAKQTPIGDVMINAVRGAIWEAWEMGRDEGESSYPSVPLLDELMERLQGPEEPEL
jgi:hypothetical protein